MIPSAHLATTASPIALINIKTPAARDKAKALNDFSVWFRFHHLNFI